MQVRLLQLHRETQELRDVGEAIESMVMVVLG